jgi:hypothetical protein
MVAMRAIVKPLSLEIGVPPMPGPKGTGHNLQTRPKPAGGVVDFSLEEAL